MLDTSRLLACESQFKISECGLFDWLFILNKYSSRKIYLIGIQPIADKIDFLHIAS